MTAYGVAKRRVMTRSTLSAPPRAERRPIQKSAHGATWTDDYAWLRAENWQEVLGAPERLAPDIRALLAAENA